MAVGAGSLILLLLASCPPLLADAFFFPVSGETQPPSDGFKVNYLKEGERLEITCTLTNETWQQSCNASHMSIRLYKKPLDAEFYIVGTQTPIGPHSIRMLVERASTNESGSYYCYCHETAISFIKVNFLIQAPPEQPVSVQIIAENMENLTVIFDPVRDDLSLKANTTWSLHLNSSDSAVSVLCSKTTRPFQCKVQGLSSFALVPTDMNIFASNSMGNRSTEQRGKLFWQYVRPVPVTAEVKVETSTRVKLTWNKPDNLQTFRLGGLLYQVTLLPHSVFSPLEINFTCLAENETSERDCARMERLLEVHPYTRYNLSLRSRPVFGGHWSAPNILSFTTPEDVPRRGPGMQPWRYTSVEQADGTYKTVIYPQGLWEGHKGGVITHYELEYEGKDWSANQRLEGTPTSIELLPHSLASDSGLTLRLWAHTAVGRSPSASSLTLLPRNAVMAGPRWLDVERVNGSHRRLHWEHGDLQRHSQVLVHRCWGSVERLSPASLVSCRTEIDSQTVEGGSTSDWFEGSNEGPCVGMENCSLHFGLSEERDGTSSGIVWNTCIFNFNEVAAQLGNLQVSGSADSLVVSWMYPCHLTEDRFQARPVWFESRYSLNVSQSATSDCNWSEDAKHSVAVHGKNSHEWTGLEAGRQYLLCARSLSGNNLGAGSWAVKVHSVDAAPHQTVALAVGLSVPVFIVVCVSVGIKLCRKLRTGKFTIKSFDIEKVKRQDLKKGTQDDLMYEDIPPGSPFSHTVIDKKSCYSESTPAEKIQNGSCTVESGVETGSMSTETSSPCYAGQSVQAGVREDEGGYGLAMGDTKGDKTAATDDLDDEHLINRSSASATDDTLSNLNLAFVQDEDSGTSHRVPAPAASAGVSLPTDTGRAAVGRETAYGPGGVPGLSEGMGRKEVQAREGEGQESSHSPAVSHRTSSSKGSLDNLNGLPEGYVRQSNHDGKTQVTVRQENMAADKPSSPVPADAGGSVSEKLLQLQAVKSNKEDEAGSSHCERETRF